MENTRRITTGRHVTVEAWEQAVVLRSGIVTRVVGAGRHRRLRRETWHLVDTRPRWLPTATQEVLSADGMQVRVTPMAQFRVTDAVAWLTATADASAAIYTLVQLAVREALATRTLDEILAMRRALLDGVRAEFGAAVSELGAESIELELRDLTLPMELRQAFAETALARERGKAKLETARAEAAALRSLANSAQLLEAHPALLELKALDAAGHHGQVIVRVGEVGPLVVS